MVCPMRGLLVVASALVAVLTAAFTALSRWRGARDSEDGGAASPRVAEAKVSVGVGKACGRHTHASRSDNQHLSPFSQSPANYIRWSISTLWDAASGRYLARQAAAAWRAASASPPQKKRVVKKAD